LYALSKRIFKKERKKNNNISFFRYLFYLQQSSSGGAIRLTRFTYLLFAFRLGKQSYIHILHENGKNNWRGDRGGGGDSGFDVHRWKMIITKSLQTISFVMWPPTANKINTRVHVEDKESTYFVCNVINISDKIGGDIIAVCIIIYSLLVSAFIRVGCAGNYTSTVRKMVRTRRIKKTHF